MTTDRRTTTSDPSSLQTLSDLERARCLAIRDLSDPADGDHAVGIAVEQIRSTLAAALPCPAQLRRAPRIVPVADNYDVLGYSAADATRAARYTRYLGAGQMLRSHTSAGVPAWLRSLPSPCEDVVALLPGVCYRRDVVDRTHVGEPHQMDVWRVSPNELGTAELHELASLVVRAVWPRAEIRLTPTTHPYTTHGQQIDVLLGGRWLEVGECGLAHPALLSRCGVEGSGLALGVGLDRLVMLAKQLPDIRLLRSTQPEVVAQMGDLRPYRSVPSVPSIQRDISICVDELDEELLGDAASEACGARRDLLRGVEVRAITPHDALPAAAHERMGMLPGQRNVLLRLTLQHDERTLTDDEANQVRDLVYRALHRGVWMEL